MLSMSSIRRCALFLLVATLPVSLHAQGRKEKRIRTSRRYRAVPSDTSMTR